MFNFTTRYINVHVHVCTGTLGVDGLLLATQWERERGGREVTIWLIVTSVEMMALVWCPCCWPRPHHRHRLLLWHHRLVCRPSSCPHSRSHSLESRMSLSHRNTDEGVWSERHFRLNHLQKQTWNTNNIIITTTIFSTSVFCYQMSIFWCLWVEPLVWRWG